MSNDTEDGERAYSPSRAARRLSALVYADLNFEVDEAVLGEFIRRRWARIAPLAHIIHDAPDRTKNPSGTTPVGGNLPDADVKHAPDNAPPSRAELLRAAVLQYGHAVDDEVAGKFKDRAPTNRLRAAEEYMFNMIASVASADARRQKAVASLRHYIASMEMNEGLLRASSLREILGELEA